jgi:hypothetical protein
MHQAKHATEILQKFEMIKCNTSIKPDETRIKIKGLGHEEHVDPTMFRQLIGSLRYLCQSKPD